MSFYHDLDHHLGVYFAFCFTLFQINWIIVMYMGFISPFSEYDLKFTSVYAAGGLIVAIAGICRIVDTYLLVISVIMDTKC